ncbi:hypothetical protein [Propionivibrio sp.]|uniref:hypothetical protein n=1 Tax=Propionivibrio sp. TaxID=2212460 RepID=UPI003BF2EA6B
MYQFNQIRERFLANARQHLLVPDKKACNCNFDCCQNSLARRTNESAPRPGKIEE